MKTHEYDFVWSNDTEFLKIEKNGKPEYKALTFVLENNQITFKKAFEAPRIEIEKFINDFGFKPTNKILSLNS
jgi:hypothetical protein